MITSPCKNCKNLSLPKDVCSKNCKIIFELQMFQLATSDGPCMAVDSSGSDRHSIRLPVSAIADI